MFSQVILNTKSYSVPLYRYNSRSALQSTLPTFSIPIDISSLPGQSWPRLDTSSVGKGHLHTILSQKLIQEARFMSSSKPIDFEIPRHEEGRPVLRCPCVGMHPSQS